MNSQLVPVNSTLLRNKLAKLAIRLQQQANPDGSGSFLTLEQTVVEAFKILSEFYKQLSDPSFQVKDAIADTTPIVGDYNKSFTSILDDLQVIFAEFENLEGVVVGEFNYLVSRLNRLQSRLKLVSSLLGDYALFSDLATRDAIFASDSFNNLYRIEANSPLLNATQCEINQVEGIVTLPVNRQAQGKINITALPVINTNSNGQIGNNWEANTGTHAAIADVLDGNADTWFEYERVLTSDDGVSLILDITVNLGEPKVVNFIRINPNNFGARTEVKIDAIDTSIDGEKFVSIKDDIPIADFVIEDEENVFSLASATSKFAGQGLYTFTPRMAKYIHLAFRQTTPYTITDWNGNEKYRYAIGIRDIEVQALPYETTGEIVSTNYEFLDEVRKVVLLSNQNPASFSQSILASIDHFVSPDNGVTWHQIRPRDSSGSANTTQTTPELLDFNGVEPGSVITLNPVKSLRYKAVLKRNTDGFKRESSEMAQEIADKTELHTPPLSTPFNIKLANTPIEGTLQLLEAPLGTRGDTSNPYYIGYGTGAALRFYLPWKGIERVPTRIDNGDGTYTVSWTPVTIDVYVDGIKWSAGVLEGDNQVYTWDPDTCLLCFGDGTNGQVVDAGSEVKVVPDFQTLFPSRGPGHIAVVSLPMVKDKKRVLVGRTGSIATGSRVLAMGQKRTKLPTDKFMLGLTVTASSSTSILDPTKEVAYIDGSSEFESESAGAFSVYAEATYEDLINGAWGCYIYTKVASLIDIPVSITYTYQPLTVLSENDWEFGEGNTISIRDGAFITELIEQDLSGYAGKTYICLQEPSIMKGTLAFVGATTGAFRREAEFIDGETELLGIVKVAEAIGPLPSGVNVEYHFKTHIVPSSNYRVALSNTDVFRTEVGTLGAVDDTVGNYYIDRGHSPTGRIVVRIDTPVDDPGSVEYYYSNDQINRAGMYSVNYETGEVFTISAIDSGITATFEVARYLIGHDIGRKVPESDYSYESETNTITIEDREILRAQRTPRSVETGRSIERYYQVTYQYVKSSRADISKLEPYFSPVLKDYALKVITKSRLI